MGSSFDDTVFDFDLNLLNQSSNNAYTTLLQKYEKQRKGLIMLKKKIIATDTLIGRFYMKKDSLDDAEKIIVSLKEQCKQLRIEYKNSLEQKSLLENKLEILQSKYKKLEESCFNFRTQYEAQLSYSNQLQTLLKEKDTRIESLRIEKKLESCVPKDSVKKQSSVSKTNDKTLLKDISLFANFVKKYLAERKLKPKYHNLLRKYETSSDGNTSDWTEDSDIEKDVFEETLLSPPPSKTIDSEKNSSNDSPYEPDIDNHELVSLDTGRGSSLAYSDNEKCLQSPDYFSNDSPLNEENIELKTTKTDAATTTSPVMFVKTVEIGTSPIIFNNNVEVALSPIMFSSRVEIATSPVSFDERDNSTSENICVNNNQHTKSEEKICLEMNSSNNLESIKEIDYEVGVILNKMKLNCKPVTPIPRTPIIMHTKRGIIIPPKGYKTNMSVRLALHVLSQHGWVKLESDVLDTIPTNFCHCHQTENPNNVSKELLVNSDLAVIEEENLELDDVNLTLIDEPATMETFVKKDAFLQNHQNNTFNLSNFCQSHQTKRSCSLFEDPVVNSNLSIVEQEVSTVDNNFTLKQCQTPIEPLSVITRKRKCAKQDDCVMTSTDILKSSETQKDKRDNKPVNDPTSRKRRRSSANESEMISKRQLRSSASYRKSSTEDITKHLNEDEKSITVQTANETSMDVQISSDNAKPQDLDGRDNTGISYNDLDMFSEESTVNITSCTKNKTTTDPSMCHPKDSILCFMVEKYGVENVRIFNRKISDNAVKSISDKLENEIKEILELSPSETKAAMDSMVADLQKLNCKIFIAALIKYLTKKERKIELYAKAHCPPAPPMTKPEQILLYIISHLKALWPSVDIVDAVLSNIEYTLFKLNRTPEFDIIESISHFYAILCRYFRAKSRLRLFILDAMYCIQYKSVALIKQCLEVWMHIIPLAHMGIAKTPLVTCLVYLLHFYKCEDKFQRVQEIRNILSRKYYYDVTNWNEKTILEMFKNSIRDLKDIQIEKKMLRLALIILAKRNGAQWCQNNIIKKILLPMIEKENVPNHVKVFCVTMIGPLMKPYPVDMKVHCEIIMNQLMDILKNEPSHQMEEAVIMSMMFINRHEQYRIDQMLLTRKMKPMSPELEGVIRDYVRSKTLKVWKKNLGKMARRSY